MSNRALTRAEAVALLRGGPDGIAEWNRQRESNVKIPHWTASFLRLLILRGLISGVPTSMTRYSSPQIWKGPTSQTPTLFSPV